MAGESITEYAPFTALCAGLSSVVVIQIVVARKLNAYFRKAMIGANKAGQILVARHANAEWNARVRAYCRNRGLVIVPTDESGASNNTVAEDTA